MKTYDSTDATGKLDEYSINDNISYSINNSLFSVSCENDHHFK